MQRRLPLVLLVVVAVVLFVSPRSAFAQNRAVEAQARALQKKAMEEDYLTVDFDKATEKLSQAIAKCGSDKCGANLRAQLKRDLSTVYTAAGKKDEALAAMVDGLKADPNLQLDPNFKTKELEAVYAEAKKAVGASGGTTGGGPPAAGDFMVTEVPEQTVRTPLPIYAEYTGTETLAKVIARYKGFGMTEFKTLELKKVGSGWGAVVPCLDVQQGDLSFYIQGFNAANDPVATAGDRNKPYKSSIKSKIAGEAPHLPGQSPPAQCADTGDCPPDFPGCKKGGTEPTPGAENGKPAGEACEEDVECASSKCKSQVCAEGEGEGGGGEKPKFRRFWVGAAFALDLPFLPSANDVCQIDTNPASTDPNSAKPVNTAGYYCTNSDGSDYPLRTDNGLQAKSIITGKSDKVSGGVAPGNYRFLLTIDYALNPNILVGVRVGYNLGTYPGSAASSDGKTFFAPVHLELRGTYVVGKDGVATKGLKPYVFLNVGASEVDAKVDVTVYQTDKPAGQTVSAWNIAGPIFVGAGGGARIAFSTRAALSVGLGLKAAFGGAGFLFVPAPELGMQFGF